MALVGLRTWRTGAALRQLSLPAVTTVRACRQALRQRAGAISAQGSWLALLALTLQLLVVLHDPDRYGLAGMLVPPLHGTPAKSEGGTVGQGGRDAQVEHVQVLVLVPRFQALVGRP